MQPVLSSPLLWLYDSPVCHSLLLWLYDSPVWTSLLSWLLNSTVTGPMLLLLLCRIIGYSCRRYVCLMFSVFQNARTCYNCILLIPSVNTHHIKWFPIDGDWKHVSLIEVTLKPMTNHFQAVTHNGCLISRKPFNARWRKTRSIWKCGLLLSVISQLLRPLRYSSSGEKLLFFWHSYL